jgi:hypothetical protein
MARGSGWGLHVRKREAPRAGSLTSRAIATGPGDPDSRSRGPQRLLLGQPQAVPSRYTIVGLKLPRGTPLVDSADYSRYTVCALAVYRWYTESTPLRGGLREVPTREFSSNRIALSAAWSVSETAREPAISSENPDLVYSRYTLWISSSLGTPIWQPRCTRDGGSSTSRAW